MSDEIKDNLSNSDNWLRVLLVLIYALIFTLGAWVLAFAVALNLLILVFTGGRNDNLAHFGQQVSRYLGELMDYATLNSDDRPFPFGEWPGDPEDTAPPPPKSSARPGADSTPASQAADDDAGAKSSKKTAAKKATRKASKKKKAAKKKASSSGSGN